MAGSGDVECFRTLRVLRKHLESDMNYGHNMAINMCMGFLFLGSGAYTFGQSKTAIAALLCSVYPHFPSSPSDNKYHLQAMRHLYVLALQTRLLQAKDVETGENVQVPLMITYQGQTGAKEPAQTVTTPAIVNQIGQIATVALKDPKYYEMEIQNVSQTDYHSHWTIYVKRRMCTMTYAEGAKSGELTFKPKLSLSVGEEVERDSLNAETHKFSTNNQLILLFLDKLCKSSAGVSTEDIESSVLLTCGTEMGGDLPSVETLRGAYHVISEICRDLSASIDKDLTKEKLYLFKFAIECFSEGKAEVLPIYLWLLSNLKRPEKARPLFFKEFAALLSYSNVRGSLFGPSTPALISPTFIADVRGQVESLISRFVSPESTLGELRTYLLTGTVLPGSQRLCDFLIFNQIPSAAELKRIFAEIRSLVQTWATQKFKAETQKSLITHIVECLKARVRGGREKFQSEEIRLFVGGVWIRLRRLLPSIDSQVVDQFLILILEQMIQ